MLELIKACLITNIVQLVMLLALIIIIGLLHIQIENKHKKEKEQLALEKEHYQKELKKRYGDQNEKGFDLGERGSKR